MFSIYRQPQSLHLNVCLCVLSYACVSGRIEGERQGCEVYGKDGEKERREGEKSADERKEIEREGSRRKEAQGERKGD